MTKRVAVALLTLILLPASLPSAALSARLRVLTVNVWSGLDYQGMFRFGEYESASRREARYQSLLVQIRTLHPDVIFLQEANPVGRYSRRLAEDLSYREIHIVCNGGMKIGSFGVPVNFQEGIAILARPTLGLKRVASWKLSGPPGIYGDALTIHFGEAIFSLSGKITVDNTPLHLVNVHLSSGPPQDRSLQRRFADLRGKGEVTGEEYEQGLKRHRENGNRREGEIVRLLREIALLPSGTATIVAGDFNALPDSPEIRRFQSVGVFLDAYSEAGTSRMRHGARRKHTWDPAENENAAFSTRMSDARGRRLDGYGMLGALWDATPRRIDYIFLSRHFRPDDIVDCRIVLDTPVNGVMASDHYGVFAEVAMPPYPTQIRGWRNGRDARAEERTGREHSSPASPMKTKTE